MLYLLCTHSAPSINGKIRKLCVFAKKTRLTLLDRGLMNKNMLINVSKRFNIPSTIDFPTKMLASLQIDKTGTVIIVRDHPDFHSSEEQMKLGRSWLLGIIQRS